MNYDTSSNQFLKTIMVKNKSLLKVITDTHNKGI